MSAMFFTAPGQTRLTGILAEEEGFGLPSSVGGGGDRLLPNDTLTPGDNVLMYKDVSRLSLRSHVARTLSSIGGAPAPFEFVTVRDFHTAMDGEGLYKFAVARPLDGTTCVLAIREVTYVGLELAIGATGTTKILRNCVLGSARDALSPILSTTDVFNPFL
ncbi:hypothetical protein [Palleronia abyssalis]|uniref:hypothetical protein n=1 Tax=Palleronia abyssalis TaxID=1501240 RepID=UPI0011B26823|nr:hypothetical protein [Palleronia abyssalis]